MIHPRFLAGPFAAVILAAHAQAQTLSLDDLTRAQPYTTHRESSSHPDLTRNGDARPIPPGETLVLGKLEGPGVITHIWCTVGSGDPFYARNLVIRVYWDGMDEPSVEAPLGDFFGVGHGAHVDFTSLPVAVSSRGRARNCFWRMPFKKSAKVTVTNQSTEHRTGSFYYYLDWQKYDQLPPDTLYFHAQYRQAMPAPPGNYTILDTKGRGHYAGTVYSAHQVEIGWFGEGDDFFYIDGEDYPSLRGTGTEDYFNDAWGFRQFSTPYHGVSLWDGYFPGDRVTAYRWHIDSPVVFNESLTLTMEHRGSIFTDQAIHLGQFIERPDWISSVAFWYQDPPVGPLAILPPPEERLAPYRILDLADVEVEATPNRGVTQNADGVTYVPMDPNASIEFTFDLQEDGRYQINAIMTYGVFGGVYQASLNGKPLGAPIDFCITGSDPIWTRFDLHDLKAGTHKLRFEGQGPSPNMRSLAPKFYGLTMNRLILLRLQDMDGYQEAMKKTLEENN